MRRQRLECAQVRVPLDWDRPDGAKITLAVARYLASRPGQRIGSLFVNFGGPGVAGAAAVKEGGALLDGLGGGRFDVVGWDPRGTGESTHVRCFASESGPARFWGPDWTIPTTPAESRRYVPKTVDYARRCEAQSGALLAHISTADTVRDLDYLRQLVGDRQADLSRPLLRHVSRPDLRQHVPAPGAGDDPGRRDRCGRVHEVGRRGHRQRARPTPTWCSRSSWRCVRRRVRRNVPLQARARWQRGFKRCCSACARGRSRRDPHPRHASFATATHWSHSGRRSGIPSDWPKLAAALDEAADGDGSRLVTPIREGRAFFQSALVPAVALQCADKRLPRPGRVQAWPKVIDRLSDITFVAPVDAWWLWAPCASWRTPQRGPLHRPLECRHPEPDPGDRQPLRFPHGIRQRAQRCPSPGQRRPAHPRRLWPHQRPGSQRLPRPGGPPLPDTTTPPPDGTVCQPDRQPFDPNFGQPLP